MQSFDEIVEVFDYATEITVYKNGESVSYPRGTQGYESILNGWKAQINGARQMPAFGVSLNNYTLEEMKKGVWVEFTFEKVTECNGMPFKKLLINVIGSFQGVNIIRYNTKSGYDGRCFYLDFNTDMSEFSAILANL